MQGKSAYGKCKQVHLYVSLSQLLFPPNTFFFYIRLKKQFIQNKAGGSRPRLFIYTKSFHVFFTSFRPFETPSRPFRTGYQAVKDSLEAVKETLEAVRDTLEAVLNGLPGRPRQPRGRKREPRGRSRRGRGRSERPKRDQFSHFQAENGAFLLHFSH